MNSTYRIRFQNSPRELLNLPKHEVRLLPKCEETNEAAQLCAYTARGCGSTLGYAFKDEL